MWKINLDMRLDVMNARSKTEVVKTYDEAVAKWNEIAKGDAK